jgi:hypothetical protein
MRTPDKFTLIWKQGGTVVSTVDVPRADKVTETNGFKEIRYPDLGEKIASEWKTTGQHRDATDKKFDQAVLHTDNETPYVNLIGVIDAIYTPQRDYAAGGKNAKVASFNVTFAVN